MTAFKLSFDLPWHILSIYYRFIKDRYPNQELMIVILKNYTYYIPFIMDDEEIFLKNIIPSRKYHKIYINKE